MDLRERAAPTAQASGHRHPWEQARAAFLVRRLGAGVVRAGDPVLDVGAGDGWLAAALRQELGAVITCWDVHFTEEDLHRLASLGLQATRELPPGPFQHALLCDVLEHVEDDAGFLARVVERVRPGGRVVVTVPAWPALFSTHDQALHHHRRYTPAGLRALLQGAGLVVDESGGLFHSLVAPRALEVLAERLGVERRAPRGVGQWQGGQHLTRGLVAALRAEQALSLWAARLHIELPGLSAWALCTRPLWQSTGP